MIVHTARIIYAGRDRLDITRKSGVSPGIEFAPSWRLLGPILAARRRHESIAAGAVPVEHVARALGQTGPAVTRRHYLAAGAEQMTGGVSS